MAKLLSSQHSNEGQISLLLLPSNSQDCPCLSSRRAATGGMPGTAESTLSDAKEHEKTLQSEHFQIQPATDCCPPTPRWDCGAQVSYSSSQVMETCRERASEARETLRPPVKGGDGERELKLNRVSH